MNRYVTFKLQNRCGCTGGHMGADAPAATFGKTAFADFASVRYKNEKEACRKRMITASCTPLFLDVLDDAAAMRYARISLRMNAM